jgi:methylamine--corrinoid protein Co-methyltransferase
MISLLDVAERIQKGPKAEVTQWERSLYRKTTQLTESYNIHYPNDASYFNQDDALVGRAYQAGIDLLVDNGVFCISTNRIVNFSREEVVEAVKCIPNRIIVGEGRDARVITQKKVEGNEPLNNWPGHHAPFSEELAPLAVKNFAMIPSADYLQGFNFRVVDGREIFGLPMEAYAARREIAWMREGIRKAGRQGMGIALYPLTMRAAALIAPMDPDYGLRRTDGVLLATLPDVKMEADVLTAAIVLCHDYGCFNQCSAGTMVGGFCGGVEGSIIEAIARAIAGWMLYRGSPITTHLTHVLMTTAGKIAIRPEVIWGASVMHQALNQHTSTICSTGGSAVAAVGTEEHLLEVAVGAIRSAIDGANLNITRQNPPHMNRAQTPLEGAWQWEVANGVMRAGIKRSQADVVLREVARAINGTPVQVGPDVREVYDWIYNRPRAAYQEAYMRAKDRLSNLGLQFA